MREIEFTIGSENDGIRIRSFLRAFGVSSTLLTHLKQTENGITVNGEFARTIDVLHSGDLLKIHIENSGKMPTPVKMDIDIEDRLLTQDLVDIFHKKNLKVNCWTVDNPEMLKKLEDMGVDYITTNVFQQNS